MGWQEVDQVCKQLLQGNLEDRCWPPSTLHHKYTVAGITNLEGKKEVQLQNFVSKDGRGCLESFFLQHLGLRVAL